VNGKDVSDWGFWVDKRFGVGESLLLYPNSSHLSTVFYFTITQLAYFLY
jgi:hypothetical protein